MKSVNWERLSIILILILLSVPILYVIGMYGFVYLFREMLSGFTR